MAANNKRALALALLAMLAFMTVADAAISCGSVSGSLAPCIPYLQGRAPAPPGGCCGGVRSLYAQTKPSRPDRVTACNCIKSAASGLKLMDAKVGALPGLCGVNLGYRPSVNVNCATIP